jgi:ABC-type transport system involved in multi-copper enzyme maturation permease subunit
MAFLLLSLAGVAMVTVGIKSAADQVEHTARVTAQARRQGHEDSRDTVRATEVKQLDIRQVEVMFTGLFGFAMSLIGSLLALVLFSTVIASEIQTGTIRVTLAKPVPRWAYLLGRWLGATVVLAAYGIIVGTAAAVLDLAYGMHGTMALVSVSWLAFCGNLILGTVGLALSLFVRAPVAGVLAWFGSATLFEQVLPLYAVLPSYAPFDVSMMMMGVAPSSLWSMALSTLYAADVVAIVALVALARFRRMEIA